MRRDRAKARHYYTRAAEAGHAGAQMNLSAYYFGEFNEKTGEYEVLSGPLDWPKALHWAQKAADQGEPGAAEKVSAITKQMQRGKK